MLGSYILQIKYIVEKKEVNKDQWNELGLKMKNPMFPECLPDT